MDAQRWWLLILEQGFLVDADRIWIVPGASPLIRRQGFLGDAGTSYTISKATLARV
ncbi:hypothetical protein C2845_PM18G00130 [Panicum miliaceum]|uniref:Uncharacterized protein n=1 Tax=Panicum miliaceum TaxID=4540 RepID=A0A3L6PL44_PANMI|nr:hypothetical protein C2845_PM18G00130 [Panicum miliaceum]